MNIKKMFKDCDWGIVIPITIFLLLVLLLLVPTLAHFTFPFSMSVSDDNAYTVTTYYDMIQSIIAILAPISGVLLGYMYFRLKKKNDSRMKSREYKREHIKMLINEISNYNEYLNHILSKRIIENRLNNTRRKLYDSNDIIVTILQVINETLGFTDEEIKRIHSLHSLIDNDHIIACGSAKEVNRYKELDDFHNEYLNRLKLVRIICYSKLA